MRFACEMLVPAEGLDDFHQPAEASQTFLRYQLSLSLHTDEQGLPRVRLEHEKLAYVQGAEVQAATSGFQAAAFGSKISTLLR